MGNQTVRQVDHPGQLGSGSLSCYENRKHNIIYPILPGLFLFTPVMYPLGPNLLLKDEVSSTVCSRVKTSQSYSAVA